MRMNPETFEVFCAVLWQKQGHPTCLPYPLDSSFQKVSDHVDRIKTLSKYHGFFHSEESSRPVYLVLNDLSDFI